MEFTIAADKGHLEACNILLEHQVDKNPRTKLGLTPLHHAAKNGHLDACKTLIEGGVEIDPRSKNRKTPQVLALHHKVAKKGVLKNNVS